ncbi:MAG: hypothetical protein WDW36_004520 [Sanguina aurantia]
MFMGAIDGWRRQLHLLLTSTALQHPHPPQLPPDVTSIPTSGLSCQQRQPPAPSPPSDPHASTPIPPSPQSHPSSHAARHTATHCHPTHGPSPVFAAASVSEPAVASWPTLGSGLSGTRGSDGSINRNDTDTNTPPSISGSSSSSSFSGGGNGSAGGSGGDGLEGVFQGWAGGLQWVHDTTGLPWWAVIPMVTLTLRATLLPLSLRQAAILRTNHGVYKEAVVLADQRILSQQQQRRWNSTVAAARAAPTPGSRGAASAANTAVLGAVQGGASTGQSPAGSTDPAGTPGGSVPGAASFSWVWGGSAAHGSQSEHQHQQLQQQHPRQRPSITGSGNQEHPQSDTEATRAAGFGLDAGDAAHDRSSNMSNTSSSMSSSSGMSSSTSSSSMSSSSSGMSSSSSSGGSNMSSVVADEGGSSRSYADWFWGDMAGGAAILAAFHLLRVKLGAPHPAWIIINPMVQLPVFMASSMSLRRMSHSGWPGFSQEGAAWFPDLITPPVIISTARSRQCGASPDGTVHSSHIGGSEAASSSLVSSGSSADAGGSSCSSGGSGSGEEVPPFQPWADSLSLYDARAGALSTSSSGSGGLQDPAQSLSFMSDMIAHKLTPLLPDLVMLPAGLLGLLLPCAVLGMSLTSLRIGFRAIGANKSGDANGTWDQALRMLPPLLFTLSFANLYFTLQMPHAMLLHWTASAAFTLSLQLALQRPALRAFLLRLPTPSPATPPLDRRPPSPTHARPPTPSDSTHTTTPNPTPAHSNAVPQPGESDESSRSGARTGVDPGLALRVAETADADVLVIMGAQFSAAQHYADALCCLDAAVERDGGHVRAHYSRGQVGSLTGAWERAEADFGRAAELAPAGPERGQAMYCLATALHTQGKLDDALLAYRQASEQWPGQAVVLYSTANLLTSLGEAQQALEVVVQALQMDAQTAQRAFRQPLLVLQGRLTRAIAAAAAAEAAAEAAGTKLG